MNWSPEHAVEPLKQEGLRSVWLVERPGESPRTAKYWPATPWSLVKHVLGISQSIRQARGAARLGRIGVRTPDVVDGPRFVRMDRVRLIRIELIHVHGRTVTECLDADDTSVDDLRSIATQLGDAVRRIAEAGYLHRDLRTSNLVVEAGPDGPVAWLIDPVGVRRCGCRITAVARMLDRLDVEVRRRRARTHGMWRVVVREALRGFTASDRRAVFARLRAHPPS